MYLSRPWNKSLHMDPLASRLPLHMTENSVNTGSSSFHHGQYTGMDTTRILFRFKQGQRSLEQQIREFLAIANHSDLPDCILIEIFCDGINQPLRGRLRREGPRSSLATFLDYALLCVGSPFTVGVAEEERDNLSNQVTTVFPGSSRVKAGCPVSRQVKAALPKPSQATAVFPLSSRVTVVLPVSSQVTAVFPRSSKATAVVPVSSQVRAVFPASSQVRAALPKTSQVKALFPVSSQVRAVIPESSQVRAAVPESGHRPDS
ncbi:hypothetical protein M9458_057738 [Cirrhinus mrigala]|uniref:Uncharacterized protein n=1 Tax=Cirrhinus mrigala TaxID=683832 RepID=A0ABD0MDA5_CIRMR